ncbi:MAG: beta-ketoacyl-ACP synthase II [Acidobacteria bacterium]|nr:beta-ketoacyl-ACP synthase II [Acidobacteriota bacterium]MXW70651.1 beta-ketoacyl-ACP synthase II [Acidobacteriota bacterium]MXX86303.1 beta-ketoacyl-ACP synthase II [Acidobacteriota bacterium]MYE44540.1 beta-ketoacyl-ACP synthase II [Acidobacteriota bacterium]MYF76512.1 beta-ketoacyl-ACP synthase II [Acidobacteriota bacterium]
MTARRVVVTGVGLVSPLGIGTRETWDGLVAGRSGAGRITRFDASDFTSRIACEVKGFDPLDYADRRDARKMDTFIQYALAASLFAAEDAALETPLEDPDRVGVVISSGIGGFETIEREHRKLLEKGPRRISPFFVPAMVVNLAAGWVSIRLGARGPNSAMATACSAGAHAVGEAFRLVRHGHADVMVAGGAEATITPMCIGGFASMKALSTRNSDPERASRPFDRNRDGFVVGEGAGILILEERERARARGATLYAEVIGYGMSGDAFHITAPAEDGGGAVRVMQAALAEAGASPEDVDAVNAHGTSTPLNDRIETAAIRRVFGGHADRLAVSSTKSMTGHLLGGAGGLEAGIACLTLHHQTLPPTINHETPDPDCDLDIVPNTARPAAVRSVLSNSFGFGGTNVSLLFRQPEDS